MPPPVTLVPVTPVAPIAAPKKSTTAARPVIDPIAALTPTAKGMFSVLQPGTAQLELGATPIESPGPTKPIPVSIVAEQGSRVRVAVRLDHARFVVWTERARLFAIVLRDARIALTPGQLGMSSDKHVVLRAGAAVTRLARKDAWTHVRYSGAIEVEGWLPDATLGEEAPARGHVGRIPSARRTMMAIPGTVIRSEPKWGGRQLAVMANGYYLETERAVDDAWNEVAYADGDLLLTGFASRRDPPGRVHRKRPDPALAPVPITPNTKVASGTCLHARIDGDPIGYLDGDRDVDLADSGRGWWTLTINTPWGPVAFAAKGHDPMSLVRCAPPNTVPASTLSPPSVP